MDNYIDVKCERMIANVRELQLDTAELWLALADYAHKECAAVITERSVGLSRLSSVLDTVAGIVVCVGIFAGVILPAMMI